MECNHARLLLALTPPQGGELEPSEAGFLEQHLAECSECAALAHAERLADEKLGSAMRAVPVPIGLRERVLKKLSVETDKRQRRLLVRSLAVAAGLLLAVGLGYWWVGSQKIEVRYGTNLDRLEQRSAEQVQEYFDSLGVAMVPPPRLEFNYEWLDSFGMADFDGRQVPHLLFVIPKGAWDPNKKDVLAQEGAIAHVYVLTSRFNLEEAKKNLPQTSGRYRVTPVDPPGALEGRYLFVVLHTSEDVKAFLPANFSGG